MSAVEAGANLRDAVILAAGRGCRLGGLGTDTPKALLEVGGVAILGRLLDALSARGVSRVSIVTGHCAAAVAEFVRRHPAGPGVRLLSNPRYRTYNNITSLAVALAEHPPGGDLLLLEGDLLLAPGLLDRLLRAGAGNHALVDDLRPGMNGTLVSVHRGRVTAVYTPAAQEAPGFDPAGMRKTVNAYRLAAELWREQLPPALRRRLARAGEERSYYEVLFADLLAQGRMHLRAVSAEGLPWAEVDTPEDLRHARIRFAPGERRAIVEDSFGGNWRSGILDFAFMRNAHFPGPRLWRTASTSSPGGSRGQANGRLRRPAAGRSLQTGR